MHNLLIISDVHLCRLRAGMFEGGQRELAGFIEHHAANRVEGRPWRLILNGDVFDFDHQATSMAERGPEDESLRLFAEIVAEHSEVFVALAHFLDAGHELVVIPGNHDLDFMWPSVRVAFETQLAGHSSDPRALDRLEWRDWFYYEPGRIWVEHGHQYEVDNALAAVLDPFDAGPSLRLPLGAHWIAGFCPVIPELAYHVDHTRGALYYLPLIAWRLHFRTPWLWVRLLTFIARTIASAGPKHGERTRVHSERRAALAAASSVPDELLRRIEAATARPRLASRLDTAGRLHAAAAFLTPVAVACGVAACFLGPFPMGVIAGVAAAVVLGSELVVAGRFHGSAVAAARKGAARVQEILEVPVVSMGHVHEATDEPSAVGRYLNSGTWSDPRQPNSFVRVIGSEAELSTWTTEHRLSEAA